MNIYEHRATIVAAGGSANSTTLHVNGGILRQVLVRANTATTVFEATLTDKNSVVRRHFDFHTGEINMTNSDVQIPLSGEYVLDILNASPNDDTFSIILAVEE